MTEAMLRLPGCVAQHDTHSGADNRWRLAAGWQVELAPRGCHTGFSAPLTTVACAVAGGVRRCTQCAALTRLLDVRRSSQRLGVPLAMLGERESKKRAPRAQVLTERPLQHGGGCVTGFNEFVGLMCCECYEAGQSSFREEMLSRVTLQRC